MDIWIWRYYVSREKQKKYIEDPKVTTALAVAERIADMKEKNIIFEKLAVYYAEMWVSCDKTIAHFTFDAKYDRALAYLNGGDEASIEKVQALLDTIERAYKENELPVEDKMVKSSYNELAENKYTYYDKDGLLVAKIKTDDYIQGKYLGEININGFVIDAGVIEKINTMFPNTRRLVFKDCTIKEDVRFNVFNKLSQIEIKDSKLEDFYSFNYIGINSKDKVTIDLKNITVEKNEKVLDLNNVDSITFDIVNMDYANFFTSTLASNLKNIIIDKASKKLKDEKEVYVGIGKEKTMYYGPLDLIHAFYNLEKLYTNVKVMHLDFLNRLNKLETAEGFDLILDDVKLKKNLMKEYEELVIARGMLAKYEDNHISLNRMLSGIKKDEVRMLKKFYEYIKVMPSDIEKWSRKDIGDIGKAIETIKQIEKLPIDKRYSLGRKEFNGIIEIGNPSLMLLNDRNSETIIADKRCKVTEKNLLVGSPLEYNDKTEKIYIAEPKIKHMPIYSRHKEYNFPDIEAAEKRVYDLIAREEYRKLNPKIKNEAARKIIEQGESEYAQWDLENFCGYIEERGSVLYALLMQSCRYEKLADEDIYKLIGGDVPFVYRNGVYYKDLIEIYLRQTNEDRTMVDAIMIEEEQKYQEEQRRVESVYNMLDKTKEIVDFLCSNEDVFNSMPINDMAYIRNTVFNEEYRTLETVDNIYKQLIAPDKIMDLVDGNDDVMLDMEG